MKPPNPECCSDINALCPDCLNMLLSEASLTANAADRTAGKFDGPEPKEIPIFVANGGRPIDGEPLPPPTINWDEEPDCCGDDDDDDGPLPLPAMY